MGESLLGSDSRNLAILTHLSSVVPRIKQSQTRQNTIPDLHSPNPRDYKNRFQGKFSQVNQVSEL